MTESVTRTTAGRYRKKPVEIEAFQFLGPENCKAVCEWANFMHEEDADFDHDIIVIETLEGTMEAHPGDWLIRGVKGELYPCKPDIFGATYEAVL